MQKYKLSDETRTLPCGTVLHRVVATTTFTLAYGITINAGDVGGWIEKESNLSDNAWVIGDAMIYGDAKVYDNAVVYDNAWVSDNAQVFGNARVSGDAEVCGNAKVSGDAWIFDNAWIYGNAQVAGDAQIFGNAQVAGDAKVTNAGDYIVFKNSWSSGRYFTWTKSNDMWAVGCFYGTGDELIKKAYADSEVSGKHYEAYVTLVETLKNVE